MDTALSEEADVEPLLTSLKLDKASLIQAVRYADSERALCTGNDVHGFAAFTVYDKVARALRERYVGRDGWERDETDNQAGIRHPELKIRVVPVNFDENAGNGLLQPTNSSPKGEKTKAKARCNGTGWLPGLPEIPHQEQSEYKTWILGVRSVNGEPLRAELSFPVAFEGKFFTRFAPRIILLDGTDESPAVTSDSLPATEIVDIPIHRK